MKERSLFLSSDHCSHFEQKPLSALVESSTGRTRCLQVEGSKWQQKHGANRLGHWLLIYNTIIYNITSTAQRVEHAEKEKEKEEKNENEQTKLPLSRWNDVRT